MRPLLVALVLGAAVMAGCLVEEDDAPAPGDDTASDLPSLGAVVTVEVPDVPDLMTFAESVVGAAQSYGNDLYEPTMEVCDDGSIYITAHTILADTTGAPVFGSHDDGATWAQLPFASNVAMPSSLHGATPPPSDEIFLSCGDNGWLYGVDITLATFPVNGWSGYGTEFAYHNPNAYDEAQVSDAAGERQCVPAPIKDRPWGAYAGGTLLMVSNPGAGPLQLGILDVPPMLPASIGATVGGASWNTCAGPGSLPASCSIPGVPDIRADGAFAAPQLCQGSLMLAIGNKADIDAIGIVPVFETSSGGEITSRYGQAHFDAEGTLFVGISNNTQADDDGNRTGQMQFAVSTDAGNTFVTRTFVTGDGALRHFYMDPNDFGPGALVVWAVDGEKDAEGNALAYDWYMGHLLMGADGGPELVNVALAIDEGPQPSAHVTGAAVGPDGRAYTAMYRGSATTPLSVFMRTAGPTLPVTVAATQASMP